MTGHDASARPIAVDGLVGASAVRSSGRSRTQRTAAGLVLLLVLTAVLLPRWANPPVVGVASRAPLPLPPPVGACVLIDPTAVSVADCAQPHTGQVTSTWDAEQSLSATLSGSVEQENRCAEDLQEYALAPGGALGALGASGQFGAVWEAVPARLTVELVRAPDRDGAGDLRWSSCVLMVSDSRQYRGAVDIGERASGFPAAFRSCSWPETPYLTFGCDSPHGMEVLATMRPTEAIIAAGTAMVDHTEAELQQSCVAFAGAVTGNPDPTFGGRLEISGTENLGLAYVFRGDDPTFPIPLPSCVVRLHGEGGLTDSVAGLGTGDLPIR